MLSVVDVPTDWVVVLDNMDMVLVVLVVVLVVDPSGSALPR